MCQGPEVCITEEEMNIEMEVQGLEEILSCFDVNLNEDEEHELDDLIRWMNERNMFNQQWLDLETVIKCYEMIEFIKDCHANEIVHGYVV